MYVCTYICLSVCVCLCVCVYVCMYVCVCIFTALKPLGQLKPNVMWNLHGIWEESLFKWSRSFVVFHYCHRGGGGCSFFSRDFTTKSPQCRAFSRALKTEKLKAPLFPGPVGNGMKVPSTSSLSVYKRVLAHNLNDIRNWASLIGLLFRICWCLLSIFLIYCSDEWKKLVNLIYCFQVLFRMNFKIMCFIMKILGNTPSADSAAFRDSLSSQNATWGIVFFLLILLMTHWIQGLNVWETP